MNVAAFARSTSETITWPTTIIPNRSRPPFPRRGVAAPRRISSGSLRMVSIAGRSPNCRTVPTAMAPTSATTRRSSPGSLAERKSMLANSADSHRPTSNPPAAPASANAHASVNAAMSILVRDAPRHMRTPSSRRRAAARASIRLATLLHATKCSSAIIAQIAVKTISPLGDSRTVMRRSRTSARSVTRLSPGYISRSPSALRVTLAFTSLSVAPGASRPMICVFPPENGEVAAPASRSIVYGIHRSVRPSGCIPVNPGGATPTIVNRRLPSITCRSTTPGSAPNFVRHKKSLMTTTGCDPAGSSSSARMVRPICAGTPSRSK